MYDAGQHTVEEIAATFGVARGTLYRHLAAYRDGRDCVLVVYRNTRAKKIDANNRRYGETGGSTKAQLEADRKWWPIAPARRPHLKGIVYVADGTVVRIRGIDPDGPWEENDDGYVDAPGRSRGRLCTRPGAGRGCRGRRRRWPRSLQQCAGRRHTSVGPGRAATG